MLNEEWQRIFRDWNGQVRDYPLDRCVHELIEEQATRTPNAIAVADDHSELSYAQLNARANQLAAYLCRRGARSEMVVGLCSHRDAELMVMMVGILKSGAAYLPLDPQFPADRLGYFLNDADVSLVVGRNATMDRIPSGSWSVLDSDALSTEIASEPESNLGRISRPSNLMYIIYTSGSTGRPKGVEVPHSGVVNFLSWTIEEYASRGTGGAPVFSSIAFDMIMPNLFTPLLMGERVYMLHDSLNPAEIAERLCELSPFNFVKMTPGHLDLLGQLLTEEQAGRIAATLAVGADTFPVRVLNAWRRLDRESVIFNDYGPTEASVSNGAYRTSWPMDGQQVPIGRAISNTAMYVLDDGLEPVSVGVPGELYIGGECVVRGYRARPELTAARFIPDPFSTRPGGRLYRTGDLARWRSDGQLEFLGRNDDQVKIDGHRIELGELEAVLAEHPQVAKSVAAVIGKESGRPRLAAYYVPRGEVRSESLIDYLAKRLPNYLVPHVLMSIEEVPLNANGKVDRRALPHPSR